MNTVFWIVGTYLACNVVFSVCELVTHFCLHGRFQQILGGAGSDVTMPVDPIRVRFPIGTSFVDAEISKDRLGLLGEANAKVGVVLKRAGLVEGFLAVATCYGLLAVVSPSSAVPYWCLLFLPVSSFANVGRRGLRVDRRKLGEIRAILNQLFVSVFTMSSLIGVIIILALRAVGLLP